MLGTPEIADDQLTIFSFLQATASMGKYLDLVG